MARKDPTALSSFSKISASLLRAAMKGISLSVQLRPRGQRARRPWAAGSYFFLLVHFYQSVQKAPAMVAPVSKPAVSSTS